MTENKPTQNLNSDLFTIFSTVWVDWAQSGAWCKSAGNWLGAQQWLLTIVCMLSWHLVWALYHMVTGFWEGVSWDQASHHRRQKLLVLLQSRLKLAQKSQVPPSCKRKGNRLHLSVGSWRFLHIFNLPKPSLLSFSHFALTSESVV